ncbi:peptidoglycan DD-metalloendopeptidase family protein [Fulvimonas sp. R45]|uniref:murein hydrolase activator EnvC family protein n=1 Tax=Fulvimonas sp. R45 TaxID=3045937 RepID=UPI00265FB2BB|nr:peptidoglycan DD-metalloendopeptidase family protein [Fulvimonas sp. R45]MDO1528984.1 peptidoglycan DD-metalloendopeptidase family protein [Fulvimonas sp. R45]
MPPVFPFPTPRTRLLLCLLLALPVVPAAAHQADQARSEQAQAQQKLSQVREKMKALAHEQAQTAARRDSLDATLAKQAEALAAAARAVRETDAQIAARQQQLDALERQRADLQQKLHAQRAAIADLLRATYALGRGSDLRVLLDGDDVARVARALAYSKYFQQDRARKVRELMGDLAKLQDLQASIATEQQALEAQRAQRQAQEKTLRQQRAVQQKLASQADAQYRDQAQRLAAMKQNEQSLNQLLGKLQKAIDEAARAAAAAARARHAPPPPKGRVADIRGDLPWPASGAVHDYGNGVLIAAPAGSEVHAVAAGRVVYAHFLRGYGLLVIVNHGDGWMSMYGNNETLLHDVGDAVQAGTVLGTALPSTSSSTGVYFELRHDRKPVDPRSWLRRQR